MTRANGIDWQAVRRRMAETEKAIERCLSPDAARLRAVLRQRAARLAMRRHQERLEPQLRVLGFWLGDEHCALELTAVAEVLPFRRCTPVPGMPPELLGVVNLRGHIRPVIELSQVIGAKGATAGDGGYILFLRGERDAIGARVERVEAVRDVGEDELARPGDADGALSSRFARGMARDALVVLDAQAVGDALRGILKPAA